MTEITIDLTTPNGCRYNYGGRCLVAKKLTGTYFCHVKDVKDCVYMRLKELQVGDEYK